ncbi:MAG: PEP-CTERM sorting domain-containing protein [Phycisphaerales bacterium]|nr:PEP-CTERM sorting domain-containing protein [Phycisphaerales bacterium]
MKSIRTFALSACLGVSAIAASAGTASAAFIGYEIAADNSARDTLVNQPPLQYFHSDLGPLYTAKGSPVVVDSNGVITFNFNACISAAFSAGAPGSIIQQTTDGHLVLNIHFDEPTSISAIINEGGVFRTSGDGTVNVDGGMIVVEAVSPIGTESSTSVLDVNIDDNTGKWDASATTTPLNGLYTDYQIIIDNSLFADASNGSASIWKRTFTIEIIPGGGNPPYVPEPASLSLLGIGAGALFYRRRRG